MEKVITFKLKQSHKERKTAISYKNRNYSSKRLETVLQHLQTQTTQLYYLESSILVSGNIVQKEFFIARKAIVVNDSFFFSPRHPDRARVRR